MSATPHEKECPARKNPDKTCYCPRLWLPESAVAYPEVNVERMRADLGELAVRALENAGRLYRDRRGRYLLSPESLAT